jgi:hypothetical protein
MYSAHHAPSMLQPAFFPPKLIQVGPSWSKSIQADPSRAPMKSIFIDCNDQLAPVWDKVVRPDDPKIDVNRKAFARDELPRILNGYEIALDDHSYMPTDLVAQCPQLKHIVFLGTGAASYMNVDELKSRGVSVRR